MASVDYVSLNPNRLADLFDNGWWLIANLIHVTI